MWLRSFRRGQFLKNGPLFVLLQILQFLITQIFENNKHVIAASITSQEMKMAIFERPINTSLGLNGYSAEFLNKNGIR